MNVPLIVAGVVLWTLNIWTSVWMIQAGFPQIVVVTATLALLFTLLVSRRRIARGAAVLAARRDATRTDPLKGTV